MPETPSTGRDPRPRWRRWRALAIAGTLWLGACSSAAPSASPLAAPSRAPTDRVAPTATPGGSAAGSTGPSEVGGPPACGDATLVWDARRSRLLLVTCVAQTDPRSVETIWTWDGADWQLVDRAGPPALVVTGAAFDSDRGVLVRYGGLPLASNDCVPETWEWDGSAWSMAATATDPHPTTCDHLKLTYDSKRHETLLVGGGQLADLSPETWAWDGRAWTLRARTGPEPRAHHGFTFDAARGQSFVYGGYDGSQVFDDLWSWDGVAWQAVDVADPGPRSHAGFAVGDAASILLVDGASGPSTFRSLVADTWLLEGGRWSRRDEGPGGRASPALGYDAGRGVWVLYGGFGAGGSELGDTWEFDGHAWRCADRC